MPSHAARELSVFQEPRRNSGDILIRNLTAEPVRYRIKTGHSETESEESVLEAGDIRRFTQGVPLIITFWRSGRETTYRLTPGTAYNFRYDEDGEVELYQGSHGRTDAADLAPFVASPMAVVEKMLEMAGVTSEDIVYDIGCGDGRIVILAARKYGAKGVGIDIDPQRIQEARAYALKAGVENLVEFRLQDAMKADISDATVVTLYLLPESNALLRPLLEKQLKPGTRVVSHNYSIPGWTLKETGYETVRTGDGEVHTIFLYRK